MSEAETYADVVLGDRPGWAALRFGRDGGTEKRYRWPAERDQVLTDVMQHAVIEDVYVSPYVRFTDDRRKGSALPPLVCHADLDAKPADPALYATLDAFVVSSGSPGHRHVYVPLSDPVDLGTHRRLQVALRDRLGGDDKIADNDLLRMPGTSNHKTTPPTPVTIESPGGRVWEPAELAELLDVDLQPGADSAQSREPANVEAPPDPLPAQVRRAKDAPLPVKDDGTLGDRSKAHYRLVAACKDAGLSIGQTFAVALTYGPSVNKYGARLAEQVAVSWAKAEANNVTLTPVEMNTASPVTLDECHSVFRRWLGEEYDLDAIDSVLCAAACEQLTGDPLWLLVISGSGNAKTETVQALGGIGAVIVSTISSDAALLSGTPKHERAKNATGGLLRKIGPRGVLVIKDVTSILSTSRELRGAILAALREVHDGRWTRDVGTEGGLTLVWEGRLVVVGAVTTAWDQAHSVIATMGDRFVLVRMDSHTGRNAARRQAIRNTGSETTMRAELAAAAAGVLAGLDDTADLSLTEEEAERIGVAADLVTLARTAVVYDYRGDVIDAHAPEMPTRFAKQLAQIIRSGIALGMHRTRALRLAIRCARDSMPPLRLAIIDDLAEHPHSTPGDIRHRVDKPRTTVDRQCQALHMLGVLTVDEVEYGTQGKVRWHYLLADGIDPDALTVPVQDPQSSPVLSVTTPNPSEESAVPEQTPVCPTDITGELSPQVDALFAQCAVPRCGLPPRRSCLTCAEHMTREHEYRSAS